MTPSASPSVTPPWAPGRLPVLGHAHRLLGNPLPLLRELPGLGPVVRIGLGPRPLYMVTTSELVRSIGLGTAGRFHRDDFAEAISPFAGRTLVTLSGAAHKRRRRLISPAFHRNRIAAYTPEFTRLAEEWVQTLPVGDPIDLAPPIEHLSLDTLVATVIAADLGAEAREAVRTQSPQLLSEAAFRTILPKPLWNLRPLARRRFLARSAHFRSLLADVVAGYRAGGGSTTDLLSVLVDHSDPGTGERLDDEAIVDELVGFLLGGIETPSGMFISLVHELVRAPDVRDRLVAELDEVVGDRPVTLDDAAALPYLRSVIQETLRMWASWFNLVVADGPVTLGELTVPDGTLVAFSPNMVHRVERYYPDPERFLPSRWDDPAAELVDPTGPLPFGLGTRRCPGDHFSWAELTVWTATLLRHRLPVVADPDEEVGVMTKGVGIRPATANVVLYPRR